MQPSLRLGLNLDCEVCTRWVEKIGNLAGESGRLWVPYIIHDAVPRMRQAVGDAMRCDAMQCSIQWFLLEKKQRFDRMHILCQ